MPDRHQAFEESRGTDPFMAAILFTLLGLMALVLPRSAGLSWQGILHWTGELLLVLGILLAAKGISDVRREWTGLPGFWGTTKQRLRSSVPALHP